jgi:ankyrin repeat protein
VDYFVSHCKQQQPIKTKNMVQLLLNRGADANAQGSLYGSALQVAAAAGRKSIMQLLLNRGADANAQGGYYGSVLQAAAVSGCKNAMQLLLVRGADVNAKGGEFGSALQVAAWEGRNGVIQILLDGGADINAKTGVLYGNALYTAIARGYIHSAEFLISRGAKVSLPGPELEEEFRRLEVFPWRQEGVERLRKFHKDPSGYIAAAKGPW